ncbi:MAG TPA: alpha-L-fucosidase [Tepidisphaeraceae bacterium]
MATAANDSSRQQRGAQRHPPDALHAWESLGYGMFIHFGMSTYDGDELSKGDRPSALYAPDRLDVDQWIQVARDAGMKYAVLTAKHVAGHCLWPSKCTEYHVGTSGNKTDVVAAFTRACEKHGLMAGVYYCSWDNHHTLGSMTPTYTKWSDAFTTPAYREFQSRQIEELLTQYGPWGEVWIDIPGVLGAEGRRAQYQQIAELAPSALIMMNSGFGDGTKLKYDYAWPTDLMAIERNLPHSEGGYQPWHPIADPAGAPPKEYYIPGEVCDPIGRFWFYFDNDPPRSDGELLGMRLICRARKANLLLNVPPDRHGVIPDEHVKALTRLHQNLERVGV